MAERTRDTELDELKADIARLREELSGLIAGVRKHAGTKTPGNHSEGEHDATEQKGPVDSEQNNDMWSDLLRTFETSKAQGERVIKNITAEVEQHPLASIVAAFGLGYIIAKLWHEGDN